MSDDDEVFVDNHKDSNNISKRIVYTKRSRHSMNTDKGSVYIKDNKTIYTAGRPPWYNSCGQINEPLVIGLTGGSGSGKTTVARKIIKSLNVQWVSLLSMDSFYKVS
jgi:uridine kinase